MASSSPLGAGVRSGWGLSVGETHKGNSRWPSRLCFRISSVREVGRHSAWGPWGRLLVYLIRRDPSSRQMEERVGESDEHGVSVE